MKAAFTAGAIISVGISAGPAPALTIVEHADREGRFAGAGCGAESTVSIEVPRGAVRPRVATPKTGAVFADDVTEMPAARLRSVQFQRSRGRLTVRFTAVGSDDSCARPAQYAGRGWSVSEINLDVVYRINRPVYFDSYNRRGRTGAKIKPGRIRFGKGSLVYRLRWPRWNGRVARGRGRLGGRRVAVTLSRPRYCGFRLVYRNLVVAYTGKKPPRARRRYRQAFFCR